MVDVGLDTSRLVESGCVVPLGAGLLLLLVPEVAVRVILDHRYVLDEVEVTG